MVEVWVLVEFVPRLIVVVARMAVGVINVPCRVVDTVEFFPEGGVLQVRRRHPVYGIFEQRPSYGNVIPERCSVPFVDKFLPEAFEIFEERVGVICWNFLITLNSAYEDAGSKGKGKHYATHVVMVLVLVVDVVLLLVVWLHTG